MAAGGVGPIIGQRTDQSTGQFDHDDRYLLRRSVGLSLAAAIGVVVLTACAWDPPTIERTPRAAAGTESSAKSRFAARKSTAQNGAAADGAADEKIEEPATETAALEVDLTNFKERLIGLDSDEINDLLGTPDLERAEPPALIWQYRHQICTVDIFMFDDGAGATADHVEVRSPNGGSVNEKDCFTAIVRHTAGPAHAKAAGGQSAGQQPIVPSPSTPVTRQPGPAAPAPARASAVTRPPVPSTAAPSAAPAVPAAKSAAPDGDDGPPPADTDIDFDFGPAPAPGASGSKPPAAPSSGQGRLPSAAPSGEAIPTLPPEFSDESPASALPDAKPATPAAPSASSASSGINLPPSAKTAGIEEFADPLDSAPPAVSPAMAKPAAPSPVPSPALSPAMPPVTPPALPAVAPAPAPPKPSPAPVPSAAAAPALPPAPHAAATIAAPLAPVPRAPTATAAAQPKAAPKGPAVRPVEMIEDEDLPPDLLTGMRDDDPARNDQDMVE